MTKNVIVTGVQGQDGSILTSKLLKEGFRVTGIGRRRLDDFSTRDQWLSRLSSEDNYGKKFTYQICDLRDSTTVQGLVAQVKPDIIYNLAAMSSPAESWDNPLGTLSNDTHAVINILDSVRFISPETRIVQACTASIFHSSDSPIDEASPIRVTNPYAAAKYAAYAMCEQYKDRYGLFVSNAVMFNHESIWRPEAFVTRKITRAVARIKKNRELKLNLWTLSPIRDWGWAPDFMEAFKLMGLHDSPLDLVLATGVGASIEDFVNHTFELAGLNPEEHLIIDDKGLNTGVDRSIGNPTLAEKTLGWRATTLWKEISERMLENDLKIIAASPN